LISLVACVVAFAMLWGPQVVQQHYRLFDDTTWLQDHSEAPSILQNLCSVPARFFLDLDLIETPVAWLSAAAFAVPLVMCRRYRETWFCWIWLMVPVVVGIIIDVSTDRYSLSMIRYTLVAAPGIYLMLGLLAAHLPRTGWTPPALLVCCCAISIPSSYAARFLDYREISRFIASSSWPTDPVFFVASRPSTYSSEGLLSVSYYLATQHHPLYVLNRPPTPALLAQFQDARHICVISDGIKALRRPIVPGLALDRGEMLFGIAVVGTDDPPADGRRMARAKFDTDPALKLALGMR
jgi:hypothetical protein